MCGIAAACPPNIEFVTSAVRAQQQRGPDTQVVEELHFCTLGVARLSISGLNGGDQPLKSQDGACLVVFNGAIYNFNELCQDHGFIPNSSNDGEIIGLLYQRYGLGFADYLEGMFAICIADRRSKRIVFGVDQLGIKPLFWHHGSQGVSIASTVQAFPSKMRSRVSRVPPGIVWSSCGDSRKIVHATGRIGDLGTLLRSSVKEQIPREVPWGCMLSGGVDSSLVVALASQETDEVNTYTCGTSNSSDLLAARGVARELSTNHHEILVDCEELPDIVDNVIEATASIEPWTIMAGVGTYLTARRARQDGIKVLLSGEGADELFGGYDEFEAVPRVLLNAKLENYQADLGVSECLRLDRATMAHGIEARVPFLSTSIIRHARSLPTEMKIAKVDGKIIRKYALREFAETVLSENIAQRAKEEFTNGSGLTIELRRLADNICPAPAILELRAAFPSFPILNSLSGWFFLRWLDLYGSSIGCNWHAMQERGLFRQTSNNYVLTGMEPINYQ